MRTYVFLSFLSPLLLLTVACGGNVVVDGAGAAGRAGAGTGGDGGAESIPASCTDMCNARQAAGCYDDDLPEGGIDLCIFRCAYGRSNAASCVDAYDANTDCNTALVQDTGNCMFPNACSPLAIEYGECILHGVCDAGFCAPTDNGYGCTRTCGGVTYESDCTPSSSSKTCSCRANGVTLGSCQPPNKDGSHYLDVELTVGCCAPFFAMSK